MNDSSANQITQLSPAAKSNLWFYPGEKLNHGEMRVTLMGTGWGNVVSPSQKGPSIFVELGNHIHDPNNEPDGDNNHYNNHDSFVFDVGPGCILNYNAMEIPMSRMNRIFLSHLHMDHCSDLPFIYAFGPNLGDRFIPLEIYGPSGPKLLNEDGTESDVTLGTKNLVKGMQQFTQWHTTSFATMSAGAAESYQLIEDQNVVEFDYRICGGKVYESGQKGKDHDHVLITHFPAVHIIDGAVSYKLQWSPKGQEEYIVFVYSGDTLPNDFMIEYGKGADLLIHETAPSIELVMNGAGASAPEAFAIVCNSHTPANSLGDILAKTKPGLGVTTHSPMDIRSIDKLIMGVREGIANASDDGETSSEENQQINYQVGADLMVINVSRPPGSEKSVITTRMSALLDRPWPVRKEQAPDTPPPLQNQIKYYRKGVSLDPPSDDLKGVIFKKVNDAQQCKDYFVAQDVKQLKDTIEKAKDQISDL